MRSRIPQSVFLLAVPLLGLTESRYTANWKFDPIIIDQPTSHFDILLEGLHPETKWTLAGRERTGVSARALIGEVERFSASEMPNSLPVPIKTVSNWQRGLLTISNNSLTVHEAGGAHGELLVYFDYPSGTTLRVLVEGKRIFSGAPRSILLANGNLLEYKVNGPQSALLFLNVGDISHPGSAAINK